MNKDIQFHPGDVITTDASFCVYSEKQKIWISKDLPAPLVQIIGTINEFKRALVIACRDVQPEPDLYRDVDVINDNYDRGWVMVLTSDGIVGYIHSSWGFAKVL